MGNVYGFINFSTVNLSYNEVKTYDYSALYCQSSNPSTTNTVNSDDIGTSITYSSFANNTGRYYCIYLTYLSTSSANKYSVNN